MDFTISLTVTDRGGWLGAGGRITGDGGEGCLVSRTANVAGEKAAMTSVEDRRRTAPRMSPSDTLASTWRALLEVESDLDPVKLGFGLGRAEVVWSEALSQHERFLRILDDKLPFESSVREEESNTKRGKVNNRFQDSEEFKDTQLFIRLPSSSAMMVRTE